MIPREVILAISLLGPQNGTTLAGVLGDKRAQVLHEINVVRNYLVHLNRTSAIAYKKLTASKRGAWVEADAFLHSRRSGLKRFDFWVANLQFLATALIQ
jgi:hypothetical protein